MIVIDCNHSFVYSEIWSCIVKCKMTYTDKMTCAMQINEICIHACNVWCMLFDTARSNSLRFEYIIKSTRERTLVVF